MKNPLISNWSLQTRILAISGTIAGTILLLTAWFTAIESARSIERAMARQSIQELDRLTEHLQQVPMGDIPLGLQMEIRSLLEIEPSVKRVDLFGQTGSEIRLLASSSAQSVRAFWDEEVEAFHQGAIRSFVKIDGESRQLVTVFPFAFNDGNRGFMTIVNSLEIVDSILSTHSRIGLVMIALAILLLVLGIAVVFRTSIYRYVRHLTEVMNRFRGGDSSARADESMPGEFETVAQNLNVMLTQIQELNQHMQERIDESTAELEQRNEELELLNLQLFESQKKRSQAERLALAGQLAASLAHDIGSPLGAVSTHLQLLAEDSSLSSEAESRVNLSIEQIDRVCSIVESLLSTTRQRPDRTPVDLLEVMMKLRSLLEPTLKRRKIHFQLQSEEKQPLVEGDFDQLQQLFLNLLNNSVDAIGEEGRISVEIDRNSSSYWNVEVKDTGSGIPEENQGAIFEPFFTSKSQGRGTGLGLAVSREIIQQHNGEVMVESELGTGTKFTIRLPRYVRNGVESGT